MNPELLGVWIHLYWIWQLVESKNPLVVDALRPHVEAAIRDLEQHNRHLGRRRFVK